MKITFIVVLILIISQTNIAQSKFSVSVGGGYILNSETQGESLLKYWGHAYSAIISISYNISDGTSLFISSSYHKFYFDKNSITNIYVNPASGYSFYSNSQNSYVTDITAGAKFYTFHSNAFIKPFFAAGIGILFVRQGKTDVFITNGNEIVESMTQYASEINDSYWQLNFGLGMVIKLINNFKLVLEGKAVTNYRLTYFPLTSSIKFDF